MMKQLPLFATSLVGSWPRSKQLLVALHQRESGQLSADDFQQLVDQETARIVKLQDQLGLDVITSGEQGRDNFSSFVAAHLGGVRLMSMDDMFDYVDNQKEFEHILATLDVPSISIRNAICTGKLVYHPLVTHELEVMKSNTNKPVKITLPGAYLLTRSMYMYNLSKHAYATKEDLGRDVVKVLQQEVDRLQQIGVDIIQFDEPVLTEVVFTKGHPRSFMCGALTAKKDPHDELEFAKSVIKPVLDHVNRDKSIASMHVCRGNWSTDESILLHGSYAPLVDLFEDVNPDLLTLEYSTPRAGDLSALMASEQIRQHDWLGLGVENPRLAKVESVASIVDQAHQALHYLQPRQLLLNPDCGFATFATRPVNVEGPVIGKIKSLVAAAQQLRKEVAVHA